jgi:citrate lyase beta subunit
MTKRSRGGGAGYEIAAHPRVTALALGSVDLAAELSLGSLPGGEELLHVRTTLVINSRAAGIGSPLDGVHVDIADEPGLVQATERARALGFGGKLCIHPSQIEPVRRVFAGTDIDWAREVIDVYEQAVSEGRGAIAHNGQMVDLAVVQRARAIASEART